MRIEATKTFGDIRRCEGYQAGFGVGALAGGDVLALTSEECESKACTKAIGPRAGLAGEAREAGRMRLIDGNCQGVFAAPEIGVDPSRAKNSRKRGTRNQQKHLAWWRSTFARLPGVFFQGDGDFVQEHRDHVVRCDALAVGVEVGHDPMP